MKAPLFMATGILTLAVAVTACGDSEEELAPAVTATPVATETGPAITPTPAAVTGTPVPVPSDWKAYSEAAAEITFKYPSDLLLDAPGLSSPVGAFGERDIEFRSADNSWRGFLVSIFDAKLVGQTLDKFADEQFCARDEREGSLSGARAIFCVRETVDDAPEACVVAEYGEQFVAITAGPDITKTEFDAFVQEFKIAVQ